MTPESEKPPGTDLAHGDGLTFSDVPPLQRAPAVLKKAVVVVHMYPLEGNYTLFMRQVLNALLTVEWNQWRSLSAEQQAEVFEKRMVPRFRTTIAELRVLLERSKEAVTTERLYEAVNALYTMSFRFDAMDDFGQAWAVRSRLISQWARPKKGSGIIEWEHPPDVFQMLMAPLRFAQVDNHLLNSLRSKYAAALYENTCRYVTVKLTKRLPVSEWVRLVTSDSEAYADTEYKYFKRYVLKQALAELKSSEFCPLQLTLLETKGVRNKVTHLQFRVELKPQLPLPMGAPLVADQRLESLLTGWGLSNKKLNELAVAFEEPDLWRLADATVERIKKGGVQNPAGYFLSLCAAEAKPPEPEEGSAPAAEQLPALPRPIRTLSAPPLTGIAVDARTAFHRLRSERMRAAFDQLPEPERRGYLDRFMATASKAIRDKLSQGFGHSKGADLIFFGWLENNGGAALLTHPEEVSFDQFLQSNQTASGDS